MCVQWARRRLGLEPGVGPASERAQQRSPAAIGKLYRPDRRTAAAKPCERRRRRRRLLRQVSLVAGRGDGAPGSRQRRGGMYSTCV